jgi:hypothetical protein
VSRSEDGGNIELQKPFPLLLALPNCGCEVMIGILILFISLEKSIEAVPETTFLRAATITANSCSWVNLSGGAAGGEKRVADGASLILGLFGDLCIF